MVNIHCTCGMIFVSDLFCQINVITNTVFCHRILKRYNIPYKYRVRKLCWSYRRECLPVGKMVVNTVGVAVRVGKGPMMTSSSSTKHVYVSLMQRQVNNDQKKTRGDYIRLSWQLQSRERANNEKARGLYSITTYQPYQPSTNRKLFCGK